MYQDRLDFFRQILERDFPAEVDELMDLCTRGVNMPLGYDHPEIMLTLTAHKLNVVKLNEIRAGYIYFTGYHFMLDAVIDGHYNYQVRPAYLTPLLSGAILHITAALSDLSREKQKLFWSTYNDLVSKNVEALKLENSISSKTNIDTKHNEYISIVGRSNSTIILYEVICAATESKPDPVLRDLLEKTAYYLQLNDDLGDWRVDFNEKRYSLILRDAFEIIGEVPDQNRLADFMYGTGYFENRAGEVMAGLIDISREFKLKFGDNSTDINEYLNSQVENIKIILAAVIENKMKYYEYT